MEFLRRLFGYFKRRPVAVPPPLPVEFMPQAAPVHVLREVSEVKRVYNKVSEDILAERRKVREVKNMVADLTDDILTRFQNLSLKTLQFEHDARGQHNIKELLGCDFFLLDERLLEFEHGEDHGFLVTSANEVARTIFPMDYAVISRKDGYYHMSRMVGPVAPSEVRGRAKIVPSVMAKMYGGELHDDGSWWAEEILLGAVNGSWVNLEAGLSRSMRSTGGTLQYTIRNDVESKTEIDKTASVICAMALSARYEWHVALGTGDSNMPRVLMPTSPAGCIVMFKDREKNDGETRRAALRHWVRNHYRENSETDLAYVRDHLRGKTEFKWRDLQGEIFVSQYDLEKNEFFKQQADEWRSARKHNRVKVKLKRRK